MSRPTYIIHLQPLPGVDPVQALRAALKRLLRNHGLRCIRATVTPQDEKETANAGQEVGL